MVDTMMCAFAGCTKPLFCKGLCRAHYAQKANGRPLSRLQPRGLWGPAETITWAGKVWRRWPGAPQVSHQRYYQSAGKYLHREVWRRTNGPIPKGMHVHHKDEDWNNNALDNLECRPGGGHVSEHQRAFSATPEGKRKRLLALAAARPAAAKWHASKAGRRWHSRQAKAIDTTPRFPAVCKVCGEKFLAYRKDRRVCSRKCYARDFRRRHPGYRERFPR